ncbi:MAG: prohibitin family protein [Proteobacteria bacterium]|nr:prohibitin family protein [Pseudomonadota bacterium]
MSPRFETLLSALQAGLATLSGWFARGAVAGAGALARARALLVVAVLVGGVGYLLYRHPPFEMLSHGEMAVRTNRLTGASTVIPEGGLFVFPGVHQVRRFPTHDLVYRPQESASATGSAPFQSAEGLSIGVDLSIRYAIDPARVAAMSKTLPDDLAGEIVEPAVQGVVYRLFAGYTVKEIFSSRRAEIQQSIESELKPRFAKDGLVLRGVQMGKVDLPQDYRNGMDRLLAEELESEKMRFTLELKDKKVKQTALEAEADKVRREKAAEAAAVEQVIAARAQEEAMKHVLPFKQKQVEQRQLEAEAEKVARIRSAEGAAEARRIEANGEAQSRQKLADAEAYRLDLIGKVTTEQMQREGKLITEHPLLIQKTLADKLSDRVQVIIAPPPADGGFIGKTLLGSK